MENISKLSKVITEPSNVLASVFRKIGNKGYLNWLNDSLYIRILYRLHFNKSLDLENPKTYNEKLQWLKLYDRNPEYTKYVDKYEVRKHISSTIGEEYLIPLIGVWDNVEQIDWNILPDQFVLKTTHDSGGVVICKDKENFNYKSAISKLNKSLNTNFYYGSREWPYKNVKPRIIAEKYMVDESGNELKDYKFFCFNGIPKLLFVASDRERETKFDFFDLDFNHIPVKQQYNYTEGKKIKKPANFEKMIELSKILSDKIPHVRVDFYNINGHIYFGELTFYHHGGFKPFVPERFDKTLGKLIDIPN